jgi:hypothetical protein
MKGHSMPEDQRRISAVALDRVDAIREAAAREAHLLTNETRSLERVSWTPCPECGNPGWAAWFQSAGWVCVYCEAVVP